MRHFILLAALLTSGELPMHIGDRWLYNVQLLSGNPTHPTAERWQEPITTVAIQSLPDGTLIKRTLAILNHTGPRQSPETSVAESDILLHAHCAYYQFRPAEPSTNDLPTICFPLNMGKTWGDPNAYRDHWTVAGRGRKNPDDPSNITPSAWRLEAHLASGDDNYVWFQPALGIIAERTFHHGTYNDFTRTLARFEPN